MTHNDNFVYLTFSLVLLLLGTALAQQFFAKSVQHLVQSATVITLVVAVWGVNSENSILRKNLVFPLAILAVALISAWLDNKNFAYIHLIMLLVFFISTANKTIKQVLFTGEIDGNKILGAICLYLLMGLIWAILYTLLELGFTGSFQNMSSALQWYALFPDFIYFSFVTITTLGFGDISPLQPVAKFLVYMEAIIGQFYLAILVASLVGSHMTAHSSKHADEKNNIQLY